MGWTQISLFLFSVLFVKVLGKGNALPVHGLFFNSFKFPSNLLCALMYGPPPPPPPPPPQQQHRDLSFVFWVDIHSFVFLKVRNGHYPAIDFERGTVQLSTRSMYEFRHDKFALTTHTHTEQVSSTLKKHV